MTAARLALALVLLGHAALVATRFSPADFASGAFAGGDYGMHFDEASSAAERLRRDGPTARLWGWSPRWMAGYPDGLSGLVDDKLFAAVLAASPEAAREVAFNATVIGALLVPPPLAALAGRALGLAGLELSAAAGLASAATLTVPISVYFWRGGAISFVLACALAVAAGAGLARAIGEGTLRTRRGVGFALLAALAVFTHLEALAIVGAAAGAAVLLAPRRSRALAADLSALALLVALPVLPVAAAWLEMRSAISPADAGAFLHGDLGRLAGDWLFALFRTRRDWDGGAGGLRALALLAAAAALAGRPAPDVATRTARRALALAAAACAVVAYLPPFAELFAAAQPYRFLIAFGLALAPLAAPGLAAVAAAAAARRPAALAALALSLFFVLEGGAPFWKAAVLGRGVDAAEEAVVAAVRERAVAGDRLLVEAGWKALPAWPGAPRSVWRQRFRRLPERTGLEALGQVAHAPVSPQRRLRFERGRLFGRPLAKLSEPELRAALARYAIAWVVAWTPESRAALARFPGALEPLLAEGDVVVLRVREPERSRLLHGRADVRAGLDALHLARVEGERVILKYHWIPALRATPPAVVEEERVEGAPVGFVAVRPAGLRELTIAVGSADERP